MRHLERFLDLAADEGARFVHELPESCVPIRRGEVTGPLDGIVSAAGSAA
jgi:peptidoglycan-N-acetylglucosamine deacetylase